MVIRSDLLNYYILLLFCPCILNNYFIVTVSQIFVNNQLCSIETLNGNNYTRWKSDVELALGLADLDLALLEDEPQDPTNDSTAEEKAYYHKWVRANRLSIMVMKKSISPSVKVSVSEEANEKSFFKAIGQRYQESEKAKTGELMQSLSNMWYDGVSGIRPYTLKMQGIANRLSSLKITIDESFLVHQALNSLPTQFGQLKSIYNAQSVTWNVNQLISMCVQEEERIKREHGESVNLMQQFSHSKGVSSQASASNHKKGQFGKGSQQQNKNNKSYNVTPRNIL